MMGKIITILLGIMADMIPIILSLIVFKYVMGFQ